MSNADELRDKIHIIEKDIVALQENKHLLETELVEEIRKFQDGDIVTGSYRDHKYIVDGVGLYYNKREAEYFGRKLKNNGEPYDVSPKVIYNIVSCERNGVPVNLETGELA